MRRQLAVAAAALSSMMVLAFLVPLGMLIRSFAADRALNAAEHQATLLVPVLATVRDPATLRELVDGADSTGVGATSVFLATGEVLGAPAAVDDAVRLARRGRAFTAGAPGGRQVLVPVVAPPGGVAVVRVYLPGGDLRRGVYASWLALLALGAGLVAIAVVIADRIGRLVVRPTRRLAEVAEQLGRGELGARVEPDGPPEIREVGRTLNALAARIGSLLAAEREAVADLSHRLRTPVTALRLDVEAVRDPQASARLTADVDELSRAVDRLIADARRPSRTVTDARADLAAVTRDRVAFWAALAADEQREHSLTAPAGPCRVAVPTGDLEAAVDALLGNVFAHTPPGTGFRVEVRPGPAGGGVLVVEDDGPGLPDETVVGRGRSGRGSTGLGLDIVERTATASGGRLLVGRSPSGGARLAVELGPPHP